MPRKKRTRRRGRCIHCLREGDITDDHVVPRSWYPDSTPINLEKWTAPACKECNHELGRIEARLLEVMGLCVDPEAGESLGIAQKALRALDPAAAATRRDRDHRDRKRRSLLRRAIPAEHVDPRSVVPGFEARSLLADRLESPPGLPVPVRDFERFVEKIVRGVIYAIRGSYVEQTHRIAIERVRGEGGQPFKDLLGRFGTTHRKGPGVEIALASTNDGTGSHLVGIKLWGRAEWFATVMPREGPE